MNILISAYDCSPYKGSECAVGWNWIYQYSKNAGADDHIYVVANKFHKSEMQQAISDFGLSNVTLWIPEFPKRLDATAGRLWLLRYGLWQKYAYECARQSGIHFDMIHHVSKTTLLFAGKFWKYRDAYTVFGPVGGGQEIPESLKHYQTNKKEEVLRTTANRISRILPGYRRAIRSFDTLYAVNEETRVILSRIAGSKVRLEHDIAAPDAYLGITPRSSCNHEGHRFLFSGRYHMPKKGAQFLLECLAYLPDDFQYHIDFIGGNTNECDLPVKIKELKLEDHVRLLGRLPYQKLKDVYRQYDAFVFTSLRETGGSVLYEAMASGLPVVGFNTSINRTLNENGCGIFIDVEQPAEGMKKAFAKAMVHVFSDYDHYSEKAYSYANEHTWKAKYDRIMEDYMKWSREKESG